MYSYEDKIRAVELYIKLGKRVKATIRQLGYPTKNALKGWYREHERRATLRRGITVNRSTRRRSSRLPWIIFSTMDAASISPVKRSVIHAGPCCGAGLMSGIRNCVSAVSGKVAQPRGLWK
jgi:hypothetical protein